MIKVFTFKHRLPTAFLVLISVVQSFGTMTWLIEVQAAPAYTGGMPAISPPQTESVQIRQKIPVKSPIAPRGPVSTPLTAVECTKLGGSISLESEGLCKLRLKCTRWDDNASIKRQVCIDKLID
jgi:hypothetical protein